MECESCGNEIYGDVCPYCGHVVDEVESYDESNCQQVDYEYLTQRVEERVDLDQLELEAVAEFSQN